MLRNFLVELNGEGEKGICVVSKGTNNEDNVPKQGVWKKRICKQEKYGNKGKTKANCLNSLPRSTIMPLQSTRAFMPKYHA